MDKITPQHHSLMPVSNPFGTMRARIERSSLFLALPPCIQKRTFFLGVVILPWLMMACYLGLIKTPEYESTASFFIDQQTPLSPIKGFGAILNKAKQSNVQSGGVSIFLIQNYIHSPGLLFSLQRTEDIKGYYQSKQWDYFSRLSHHPSQAEFLAYYRKKVRASVDAQTNQLTISVRAFSPEQANALLTRIVRDTRHFFDEVSHANTMTQSHLIQEQLKRAKEQLIQAELALDDFEASHIGRNTQDRRAREVQKLALKFAETEYEIAQKAYVVWTISNKKDSLILTAAPSLPEHYDYPRLPYDLMSLFVLLGMAYLLGKMVLMVVREHIE